MVWFLCGIIILIAALTKIENNSQKQREKRLDREWEELNLGSPRGRRGRQEGEYTPRSLRDQGYSEREIEFMMHNFGDQNAAD